ncbi:unnamed protein product [Didymodactylos carnosus]|uniref:Uncharacterized protein n=2 Tax=Didymodactylos carnosus TaxID=1234261 RepID=A0A815WHP1_9BILA|nr:unnamed protein product [Didymodactylos carnosus]CAF4404769.1 unnamed protein product [Didymodactylos carnosus]
MNTGVLNNAYSSVSVNGKVIVITGATSGIGGETARLLAARGAKVVLAGRRTENGEKLVQEIMSNDGEATFIKTDVTKEDEVKRLIEQTVQKYNRLDGAFSNAGLFNNNDAPHELSLDDFRLMNDVNYTAIFLCMKYEIQQFLKQQSQEQSQRGDPLQQPNQLHLTWSPYSIVNDSSILGLTTWNAGYAYSGSKHAICGLSKSAALAYAKNGIRINTICPGWIYTEMSEENNSGVSTQLQVNLTPMGRIGNAVECAELVSFLLSNASSFMTGSLIPIDGGHMAGQVVL